MITKPGNKFYYLFFCRSFVEACSKLQNLFDSLQEMAEEGWLNKKEDLIQLSFAAIRTLNTVRSQMIV